MSDERIVSAEEAKTLREAATLGPWTTAPCCNSPSHDWYWHVWRCDTTVRLCEVASARGEQGHADARLIAAAPDLARTVETLHARVAELTERCERAENDRRELQEQCDGLMSSLERVCWERDEARAIIAGRPVPPTDDEIEAHAKAGGTWYVSSTHGRGLTTTTGDAFAIRDHVVANNYAATWWAIDTRRRPCPWPVVGCAR